MSCTAKELWAIYCLDDGMFWHASDRKHLLEDDVENMNDPRDNHYRCKFGLDGPYVPERETVARIVAWLRAEADQRAREKDPEADALRSTVDAIERGEWRGKDRT